MKRDGFALLAVLWVLAAASAMILAVGGEARTEAAASQNRLVLVRARWAAEACVAIAFGEYAVRQALEGGEEHLGRTTECSWRYEDPAARLNLARADRGMIERFLTVNGIAPDTAVIIADRVSALRETDSLTDPGLLEHVGFPGHLLPFVTLDGPGLVNPLVAPAEVLAAIPGFTPEAVALVRRQRTAGAAPRNLHEVASRLSPAGRAALEGSFAETARSTLFSPGELVLRSEGWVDSHGPYPRVVLEAGVRSMDGRLVMLWRRLR